MNFSAQEIDEIADRAARRVLTLEYGDPPMTVAEHAANKAISTVYEQIGKSVVKKLLWFIGIVVIGLAAWLSGKGYLQG